MTSESSDLMRNGPKEGDFVETVDGIIFAVKGIVHPQTHILAFPKYIPSKFGDRRGKEKNYIKLNSLIDSYGFLRENHPEYLRRDPVFDEVLAEVPINRIVKIYFSKEVLWNLLEKKKLDMVEKDVVELARLLEERSCVSSLNFGVSGSVMFGLHTENSDIDLVIHGKKESIKTYEALKKMMEEALIERYNKDDLLKLYKFRFLDTELPAEQFIQIESRKTLQGKFHGRDYFIRLVMEVSEVDEKYGDTRYISIGDVELVAHVSDDSEFMFTPCRYILKDISLLKGGLVDDIREVVSFRGRFCEQAKKSEKIFVRGKLERVISSKGEYFRVVIGGKREDVLIPISFS